jgi:hypothetical protein
MKSQNVIITILLTLAINLANGQATTAPGNFWFGGAEYLGWDNASPTPLLIQHLTPNQPIRFLNFDNNVGAGIVAPKMELTVGGAMIDDLGVALPNDGLRLWNPGYVGSFGFPSNRGVLDIWTGDNNTTHMRFDGGGAIHTQNNRMEVIGKRNGLWLNAAPDFNFPAINARIFFNIGTVAGGGDEYGRFSNNGVTGPGSNIGFMRIGVQPAPLTPIDAARRLEVFDAAADPQFRITQTAGTNFVDFQVTNLGDLGIFAWDLSNTNNTSRRVGINTSAPQNTLDINANGNYNAAAPNSGLRLRDMRSGSTTTASNGKVLSVNATGDVILVDDQGAGTLSICPGGFAGSPYLTKVTAANTICESSIWENTSSDKSVGIGITSPSSTNKVTIYKASSTNSTGLSLTNDMTSGASSGTSIGIDLLTKGIGTGAVVKGIKNSVYGGVQVWGMECNVYDGTSFNIGGAFTCNGPTGSTNTGVSVAMNGGTCTGIAASINNSTTASAVNKGASLSVYGDGTNTGIYATVSPNSLIGTINSGADINVGQNTYTATTNKGVKIVSINANNNTGIELDVYPTAASITTNNTGINCKVGASSSNTSNDAKGIYVYARGGSGINYGVEAAAGTVPTTLAAANIGGKFVAVGGSSFTYGVYATSSGSCTGSTSALCPQAAGFFAGDVAVNGTFYPSDIHLKTNIQNVSNGLSIINQLQPKTYNYDTAQYSYMNLHGDLQYGLVAQDLIPVLPQCLKNLGLPQESDSTGKIIHPEVNYLGVNYTMIIPILIAGMKEQQLQIDSLINAIAAGNQPKMANPNTIEVTLSNQNKIILNQNDPNPFAENTTINYFIPDNVNAAQLLFYDNSGTILNTVDIKEKGKGSILIYGSNLSSGVYTYTLLADGKPIETKRMVKIK